MAALLIGSAPQSRCTPRGLLPTARLLPRGERRAVLLLKVKEQRSHPVAAFGRAPGGLVWQRLRQGVPPPRKTPDVPYRSTPCREDGTPPTAGPPAVGTRLSSRVIGRRGSE
jgi:hypothetical protein